MSQPFFNIVAPADGWILDQIATSLQGAGDIAFHRIPHGKGRTYTAAAAVSQSLASAAVGTIFAHVIPFHAALRIAPARRDVVLFGHHYVGPQGDGLSIEELVATLSQAAQVWTNSGYWDRWLTERGLPAEKVKRLIYAVDADYFSMRSSADWRSRPVVGLVSKYHYRKNEKFILEAVRRRRDVDWVLLGRNWENGRFELLRAVEGLPNFRYIDAGRDVSFADWPGIYRSFDIFLSPSFSEGGPFPMLEAMASGVWPIVSRMGYAEDFIAHGGNGHIFDIDDHAAFDVCLNEALTVARDSSERVRDAVIGCDWPRMTRAIHAELDVLARG